MTPTPPPTPTPDPALDLDKIQQTVERIINWPDEPRMPAETNRVRRILMERTMGDTLLLLTALRASRDRERALREALEETIDLVNAVEAHVWPHRAKLPARVREVFDDLLTSGVRDEARAALATAGGAGTKE